jgi:dihydrofolate reductase
MRKLKLQVQISIDGFICGPKGEMDWFTWNWDQSLKDYVIRLTEPVDTIVLGRRLAEGFIPYWEEVTKNADHPEHAFAHLMTNTPKVVFTKTLSSAEPWKNTVLAKGDFTEEIRLLKNQEGGDIIAYGGAQFDTSLIREDLIDEYHLFVNPVVAGAGLPIFNGVAAVKKLKLVHATPFECGITVLQYGRG